MRISDWSSDVCSSDLAEAGRQLIGPPDDPKHNRKGKRESPTARQQILNRERPQPALAPGQERNQVLQEYFGAALGPAKPLPPKSAKGFRHQNPAQRPRFVENCPMVALQLPADVDVLGDHIEAPIAHVIKCTTTESSEEHTSELQSLMRTSYAVFCLKKKKKQNNSPHIST